MQRGISLKPPYGTVFVNQPDGSIWLIYETTAISSSAIVNHFRDALLEHQYQCEASELASKAAEIPKTVAVGFPSETKHDWGGQYRMAGVCKTCGVVATGLESGKCEGKKE